MGRGHDWVCYNCQNENFAFRTTCNRCKAEKFQPVAKHTASDEWVCTACGNPNFSRRKECNRCHTLKGDKYPWVNRNWNCVYCASQNSTGGYECPKCHQTRILPIIARRRPKTPHPKVKLGDWECHECGDSNYALRVVCAGCNKAKGGKTKRKAESQTVSDGSWKCPKETCRSVNGPKIENCVICDTKRTDEDGRRARIFLKSSKRLSVALPNQAPAENEGEKWDCPLCRIANAKTRHSCYRCGVGYRNMGTWTLSAMAIGRKALSFAEPAQPAPSASSTRQVTPQPAALDNFETGGVTSDTPAIKTEETPVTPPPTTTPNAGSPKPAVAALTSPATAELDSPATAVPAPPVAALPSSPTTAPAPATVSGAQTNTSLTPTFMKKGGDVPSVAVKEEDSIPEAVLVESEN